MQQLNSNQNTALPQTRSIEESLRDATNAMFEAESLRDDLHATLTGYRAQPSETMAGAAVGVMHDADRLAGRIQSLVSDLRLTYSMVAAPNVQSLAAQGQNNARALG